MFVRPDRTLTVLLAVYLGVASSYATTIPLWLAPDEFGHFVHVMYVQENWRSPPQIPRPPVVRWGFETHLKYIWQAHQPPLFYWLNAALLHSIYELGGSFHWDGPPRLEPLAPNERRPIPWAGRRSAHDTGPYAIRFGSILVGALAVYLTYILGLLLFDNRHLALAAAGIHAFVPGFHLLVTAINNDTMAIFFSSLAVVAMAAWLRSDAVFPRGPILLAVCATALALLSKLTASMLLPLLLWLLAKKRRFPHPVVLAAALSAAGIGGFAVTYRLALHHLGWPFVDDLYGFLFAAPYAEASSLSNKIALFYATRWGSFGLTRNGTVGLLSTTTLDVLAIAGGVGFLLLFYRADADRRKLLGLIAVGLVVAIIGVHRAQLNLPVPVRDRFLFPVLPLFSVMVAAGIEHLLPHGRKHWIAWLPAPVYAASVLTLYLDVHPYFGALRIVAG